MNLLLLILIPLVTALAILVMRTKELVRWVSLTGAAAVQLVMALDYSVHTVAQELQTKQPDVVWAAFWMVPQLEYQFSYWRGWYFGCHDFITAFVVDRRCAGIRNDGKMTKEFYFYFYCWAYGCLWFLYLTGPVHPVLFLEIAVIPNICWSASGEAEKEYSANKLALLLMFGSALVLVGMLVFILAWRDTFDIFSTGKRKHTAGHGVQKFVLHCCLLALVYSPYYSFSHGCPMVTLPLLLPVLCSCRYFHETGGYGRCVWLLIYCWGCKRNMPTSLLYFLPSVFYTAPSPPWCRRILNISTPILP